MTSAGEVLCGAVSVRGVQWKAENHLGARRDRGTWSRTGEMTYSRPSDAQSLRCSSNGTPKHVGQSSATGSEEGGKLAGIFVEKNKLRTHNFHQF